MTQRTDRIDQLLRQEIGAILAQDVAGPADRVRDDHRRRDGAGPLARARLGQRHRASRRSARRPCGARAGDAVRPARAGRRLRLRRIPELHVRADDTAERGTRVLQLLAELEEGASPTTSPPGESLPTPVPRLPHEGDAADRSAPAGRRRRAAAPTRDRRTATARRPRDRPRGPPVSVDLAPWLEAVPAAAAEAIAAPATPRRRRHENPDADTLGAALGVAADRRAPRRARRPSSPRTRCRRSTTSCRAWTASARTRTRTPDYDLLVVCDCGTLDRVGAVATGTPTCSPAAARARRPPRLEHRRRAPRLGRPDGGRDVRDGRRSSPRGSASRSTRARGAGGRADGRDRDGHRDLRPPERDAADARGLGGARRGRRAAVGHLAAPLPLQARRPAPPVRRVLDRLEVAAGGRIVHWSLLTDADLAATGATRLALRGAHRPARAVRDGRGRDPVQGGRAGRDADLASGRSPAASTRPSSPARSAAAATRGRRARSSPLPSDEARRRSSPRPSGSPPRSRRRRERRGPTRRPDGILVVAKPAGPDVARRRRARAAARRRRGGSATAARSTRSPRGVLPLFLGRRDAGRRVPPRRRQALPRDGLLRRVVDDRRPRRRADAGRWAAARRGAVEAALGGFLGEISPAPAGVLARSRSAGRRAYAMARAGEAVELPRGGSRSSAWSSSSGTTRPGPADRDVDVRCSAGHVRPGARARPRRGARQRRLPRGAGPDRERAVPLRPGRPARRHPRPRRPRPGRLRRCCCRSTPASTRPAEVVADGRRRRRDRSRPVRPAGRGAARRPPDPRPSTPRRARGDRPARAGRPARPRQGAGRRAAPAGGGPCLPTDGRHAGRRRRRGLPTRDGACSSGDRRVRRAPPRPSLPAAPPRPRGAARTAGRPSSRSTPTPTR